MCVSHCSTRTEHKFWPQYYRVTLMKSNTNVSAEHIRQLVNIRIVSDEVERKCRGLLLVLLVLVLGTIPNVCFV